MKTDYLTTKIDNMVQFVAPVMGWSDTEEEETKTGLQQLGEDILKNIKEKFEDIKDDLPTMMDDMVKGLVCRGGTWAGFTPVSGECY